MLYTSRCTAPGAAAFLRDLRKGFPARVSNRLYTDRYINLLHFARGTDISTGRNSHVFCTIDISVRTGQLLDGGEREWEKKRATGDGRAQKITGGTVNVTGIIEIFAVLPMLHPRFLRKSLKYTSCTVFQRKFIHFGKDVESLSKTRAIFVCFYPVSL